MNQRKTELYTFVCWERDYTVKIPNLTWQQALIERSRKFWEYSDMLPKEYNISDHIMPALSYLVAIEPE